MASHHYYSADPSYARATEQNSGKVYINPNFQRNHSAPVPQTRSMYINPLFSHHTSTISSIAKTKIYVNPNFVKPHTADITTQYFERPVLKPDNEIAIHNSLPKIVSNSTPIIPQNTATVTTAGMSLGHVANSRYTLVRHNNKATARNVLAESSECVTKLKISKYKTVSVAHVKNNFDTDKLNRLSSLHNTEKVTPDNINIPSRFLQSRFKLVRRNSAPVVTKTNTKSVIRKQNLNSSKAIVSRSSQKVKIIINKRNLKKNNIPCPQFRKYGKCLRSLIGHCAFLHDKKHVSICRKFLKGLCHDKDCLLSHEVTAEKMPTCSFYLKGMCTKEDCPYLHVKLNEKTKICADFLRGYCEKGDKCLNRHINICPELAVKSVCTRKRCPYPHKVNKKNIHKKTKVQETLNQSVKYNNSRNKVNKRKEIPDLNSKSEDDQMDCRYYKEVLDKDVSTEIATIKPSRCKLGALPSFIHL
ncbi:zinc finger CCCH domain-containing protein 3 [Pectinophora gossypiella]|uniref:Zinc finger CCCH domain-containing protein 3 n=1 Tax=Pectinophora gossypiella TaxID=13191 RepID=A0A1E1WP60_PECGO|nr:zinc finger CCCH domain-containing protein 3 [Pectinophora gossypiella]